MAKPKATICQVLHGLGVGGAEVLAVRLARQLQGTFQFVFACLDELGSLGRELRDDRFPVVVLGRRPGVDLAASRRLAEFVRCQRVDLLHAHQYTPFFYGLTARLLCRRPPILFTEHGRWYPDYPRRKRVILNRLLLEPRDRVVGVGQSVRQALINNEGIPAERVGVIYNGIDLTPFRAGNNGRLTVRQEIGLAACDFVILQVARLDALKDHATAIRTLERVATSRRDARLVLVGEGPEQQKIEDLVRQRGLERHVRFLGLRRDVSRLLAASDLFLLTSVSEGIPLTVIEAMAAGVPVVSTRVGGVSEIVEDGLTGLLAPAGDDCGLAECVLRLAADESLRQPMGARGRARAAELFSESKMHAEYARLYLEMLHG